MGIERAKIYEVDNTGQTNVGDGIDVCFNPKEYALAKAVTWDSSKAHEDAPMPEFKSPAAVTLTVTLQFDTYEERVSVRDKYLRALEKLTMMKKKAKDDKDVKNQAPPLCRFVWGKMNFVGVIVSLGQKYTMFLSDGTPVRCEAALVMQNVSPDATYDTGTNATGHSATRTPRSVTAQQGDRFDLIAARELGDASRWQEIADLNPSIDNPASDLSNQTIQVPPD